MVHILTDLDDVILHWSQGFIDHMQSEGYDTPTAYESFNAWINSTKIGGANVIDDFNLSEKFAKLKPYEDALDVVNRLHAQGHTFTAISAVDYDPKSWQNRKDNLDRYFPNVFTSIFHVGLFKHSKRAILSAFKPTIWVEDNATNAIDGGELGHDSFLIDRPYNRNIESEMFTRVTSWYEIEKYINEINNKISKVFEQ